MEQKLVLSSKTLLLLILRLQTSENRFLSSALPISSVLTVKYLSFVN